MIKKILLPLILLWWCFTEVQAQQDAQYTMYMFNKLAYNPAYAGSAEVPCLTGLYRSQWLNLEGAPVSQSINFHTPLLRKRVGLGISINHDRIGPSNSWNYNLSYAYRIKIKNSILSLGFQGIMRKYQVDWTETSAVHSGDGLLPEGITSKQLFNAGLGLYYYNNRFYFGASVPHLIRGDLTFSNNNPVENSDFAREELHAFVTGGFLVDLGNNLKLRPSAIIKYAKNSPVDLDLHASLIISEQLWLGATYRLGTANQNAVESLDAILQFQVSQRIRLGMSYDFTLSRLRNHHSGTYEAMVDFCFGNQGEKLTNPRFF